MADVERALAEAGARTLTDGVRVLRHVRIPTRDGTRLAADVYLPAAENEHAGPWPAVVQYQPYRKDDTVGASVWQLRLPRAGYAFVQLDVRGSGGSEGVSTDEYVPDEQADGVDALAWIASQPWCDGQTNFWGSSYSGFTGLQVAAHQPPSLRTVSTAYFTDDRYSADCHYRGGTLAMYYDIGYYGTFMVAMNALPPDPELGADWARIWEQHLEGDRPYQLTWLANQVDGPYWRAASPMDHVDRITVPVFMIGGWRDGYPNPPLRLYERLQGPKRMLVGPWNHAGPDTAIPGPRIDLVHEVVRWLDHWCRGAADGTGIMAEAPITVYMQRGDAPIPDGLDARGSWRGESTWPVPGATTRTMHLGAGGRLLDARPDADRAAADTDDADTDDAEAADAFEYRPTVGGRAGGLWSGGLPFGLPGDQRADDPWSLVYRSEPLEADLAILGQARATLPVRADAEVWALALRLCDIAPDGASQLVAKGLLNVTRRDTTTDPAPWPAGGSGEVTVEIDATGWVFEAGHRIALSVSGADFPNQWPTPQPARIEILRGPGRAARLDLPVVPADGSAEPWQIRPSAVAVSRIGAAAHPPAWEHRVDILSGRETVRIAGSRDWRGLDGALAGRDYEMVAEADPADPGRASMRGRHTNFMVRGGMRVDATAEAIVLSTATEFHATYDLTVTVNGQPHAQRHWTESFPRRLL